MTIVDEWGPLGDLGKAGDLCGYTHTDHEHDGKLLTCLRRDNHAGAALAIDQHLGSLDTRPVFFGDPIELDPEATP